MCGPYVQIIRRAGEKQEKLRQRRRGEFTFKSARLRSAAVLRFGSVFIQPVYDFQLRRPNDDRFRQFLPFSVFLRSRRRSFAIERVFFGGGRHSFFLPDHACRAAVFEDLFCRFEAEKGLFRRVSVDRFRRRVFHRVVFVLQELGFRGRYDRIYTESPGFEAEYRLVLVFFHRNVRPLPHAFHFLVSNQRHDPLFSPSLRHLPQKPPDSLAKPFVADRHIQVVSLRRRRRFRVGAVPVLDAPVRLHAAGFPRRRQHPGELRVGADRLALVDLLAVGERQFLLRRYAGVRRRADLLDYRRSVRVREEGVLAKARTHQEDQRRRGYFSFGVNKSVFF